MKILVLDEEFPYPPNTGKRIRSYHLISRLARKHNILYLAYGDNSSSSATGLQKAGITTRAVPPRIPKKSGFGFYLRLLINLFSANPYMVNSHYSRAMQRECDTTVAEFNPDVILCEWTPYAVYVRNRYDAVKVFSAHNVENQIWKRYRESETSLLKKWYISLQAAKLEKFERAVFNWVDGATAVSEHDADILRSYTSLAEIKAVDNGVDLDFFIPGNNPIEENTLVFVGTMDWRPNQDALRYFASEIFPLIRKAVPNCKACFVGRKAGPELMALNERPGMIVTGAVDDIRPYIAKAAVYIVPLRIGSGTRLKILDALAMKKAIVSTRVGAEGLEVEDGIHLIQADKPMDFAAEVTRLLGNPDQRLKMGEAGRELVERRYGWDNLSQRLEEFLMHLLEKP